MEITRRGFVLGATWGGAGVLSTLRVHSAKAQSEPNAVAERRTPGTHAVVPLPFDPTKLRGLSEKLIRSHHENNYGGAVKKLNRVERELAELSSDEGHRVGRLRQRELMFRNSVVLHELYFANLGGNGEPSGRIVGAVASAYGSWGRFETQFRATANSLSGGSGWALFSYDRRDRAPRIQWAGDHSQAMVAAEPLLVLDMYEHSYHMDYGAAAGKYIEMFLRNVDWGVVNRRYESALRIASA